VYLSNNLKFRQHDHKPDQVLNSLRRGRRA
jgi:hypothetical protein